MMKTALGMMGVVIALLGGACGKGQKDLGAQFVQLETAVAHVCACTTVECGRQRDAEVKAAIEALEAANGKPLEGAQRTRWYKLVDQQLECMNKIVQRS